MKRQVTKQEFNQAVERIEALDDKAAETVVLYVDAVEQQLAVCRRDLTELLNGMAAE